MTSGDLTMEVALRRGISFIDFSPRGVPGFESNIAEVLRCSPNQTQNLLDAVDTIEEDDHHFSVERTVERPRDQGSKGEILPERIRVTITPA